MNSNTNILCDGIQGVLNDKSSQFNDKIRGAGALFEDMKSLFQNTKTPGLDDINAALSGVGDAFNMINNGINFGKLGDMAICLGLSGVGFNLNGSLSTIPDWLGLSLNKWLNSFLTNTVGSAIANLINLSSSLSNMFPIADIDSLLSLIGCLEGKCNSSYLGNGLYNSGWEVEESLNSVGVDIGGRSDFRLIDNDWNPSTVNGLNNLSSSYNAAQNLLIKAQDYDPELYNIVYKLIQDNNYY